MTDYFRKMLEIAGQIKDKALREKVLELLKNPKLLNKNFDYKALSMKEAPASLNWHHVYRGGLAHHTYAVAKMCLAIADSMEDAYEIQVDRDTLIAGALLHDIAKLFDMRKDEKSFDSTELTVDHIIMGSAELYARGFPESVVHVIASHFGEQGTTSPQSVEALIVHYADTMSAIVGTSKVHKYIQLLRQ